MEIQEFIDRVITMLETMSKAVNTQGETIKMILQMQKDHEARIQNIEGLILKKK